MVHLYMWHHIKPIYFKDSETFEDFICDYYNLISTYPFYRYGRKGQNQSGLDLYQQQPDSNGRIQVIQCKNYTQTKLTFKTILSDVRAIKEFKLNISHIFYVTANVRDSSLQSELLEHHNDITDNNSFLFSLVYYEDIFRQLPQHPQLINQYFPKWEQHKEDLVEDLRYKKEADTRLLKRMSKDIDTSLNNVSHYIDCLTTRYTSQFSSFITMVNYIIEQHPQIKFMQYDPEDYCFSFHDKNLNRYFQSFYEYYERISSLHNNYFDFRSTEYNSNFHLIVYCHEDLHIRYEITNKCKRLIDNFNEHYRRFLGYLHTYYPSIETV